MNFLMFVTLVVACVLLTRHVATRRGRDANFWTVASCLLGPLALLTVLVLPRKG